MKTPEGPREYEPDQTELQVIYTGIRRALENNQRLRVETSQMNVGPMRATERRCAIGGLAAKKVLGRLHQEYDEIAIQSRTIEFTAIGQEWVTVDLQHHNDPLQERHNLQYTIARKLSLGKRKRDVPVYTIAKKLPQFEGPPPASTSIMYTIEDREFDLFMERQLKAIVPDDIELLQRVRQHLEE